MNRYYMQYGKAWHKLSFYVVSFGSYVLPRAFFVWRRRRLFLRLSEEERHDVECRVDYYVRCDEDGGTDAAYDTSVGEYRYPFGARHKYSTYFFDLYRVARYFPSGLRLRYKFGDITDEQPSPTIVKSRPVPSGSTNSVLLKLNSVRHFRFVEDRMPFRGKRDMLVFRNVVRQPQRIRFMERCHGRPLCDVGKTNEDGGHAEWLCPYMPIEEQLKYKFIACIEGNDVATNLKWVMGSHSVAVMPRPRYETWFMEGTLKAGVHYIEVADDFSDVEEKLRHYILHPEEAEAIVRNANMYVSQFLNPRRELLIQLGVLDRYFLATNQITKSLL